MNDEQEKVWDRLKHGLRTGTMSSAIFYGDGVATRFHVSWLDPCHELARITVNNVVQSQNTDFVIINNDVTFKEPPRAGRRVRIEVYNGLSI